eukprot:scaffold27211_cov63-Phaeocystis_antarctica.AAC.9
MALKPLSRRNWTYQRIGRKSAPRRWQTLSAMPGHTAPLMSRVDAAAPPNAFVYKRLWAVQYSAGWRRRFSGGHGGGAGAGGGEGSRPVQPLEIPHPRQVESSHIHSLHHDEHGPRPAALRRTRVAAMTRRQHARMPLLARHARTRQVQDTPAGYHPLSSLRGGKSSRGYSSSALPPTAAVHCSCLCGLRLY